MADLPQRQENFEREMIHDPAEAQPESAEFAVLMNKFFKACEDVTTKSTYWIIELRKVHTNGTIKDVVAIGKNKGEGLDHVEIVFTKWWPSYVKQLKSEGYTCKSLKVYTNYSPCAICAPVLSEWLINNEDVEMSIFYAFPYTGKRFGSLARYEDGWERLQNAENLVEVQYFDTSSLRELAKRINYQDKAIENINMPERTIKGCEDKIEKEKINRDA